MRALLKIIILLTFVNPFILQGQQSRAREWNEILLNAIRTDFARPTVHARNLWHSSILMYDAWAVYQDTASPFFLGNFLGNYECKFEGISPPVDSIARKASIEEAMSFAMYRLIGHRFKDSPGYIGVAGASDALMAQSGYAIDNVATDYQSDPSPAVIGNYMAQCIIDFGLQDGSNEQNTYENIYYEPINPPLIVEFSGNPDIINPNRWQPLTLEIFIDQSGHVIPLSTPDFLSPEWGNVVPFALSDQNLSNLTRDGFDYKVFHDPGQPPYLNFNDEGYLAEEYKWNFALVAAWSSQLDPKDSVMWDISPASIGNIPSIPDQFEDYRNFFDIYNGGDPSVGWSTNPHTGLPYEPQIVPRGDYTRVLAEFWADGPDSETPPGHWFTILNKVNDHPDFVRRFKGEGPVLDALEWDVKAYFIMGGAMHDAAVAAWSIKGYYDYIRPMSAIRYMADKGQSSDTMGLSYDPNGLPLIEGYIELVLEGDMLAATDSTAIGKIKIKAWRGPNFIMNPDIDVAGVGWILAENWWPYQRSSFVTPPFAGYVSGHSTYSRAAAEVMTLMTGDEFFPGGMGTFEIKKNEFLVFEEGPSVDMTLQWATYRDASEQTSLSRIWGGIHPPADDLPGRLIGIEIGHDAFAKAEDVFTKITTGIDIIIDLSDDILIYPNPINNSPLNIKILDSNFGFTHAEIIDYQGHSLLARPINGTVASGDFNVDITTLVSGYYLVKLSGPSGVHFTKIAVMK